MIGILRILFGIGLLLFQIQSLSSMEEETISSAKDSSKIVARKDNKQIMHDLSQFLAPACIASTPIYVNGKKKDTETPNSLFILAAKTMVQSHGNDLWDGFDKSDFVTELLKGGIIRALPSDVSLQFYFCNGNANALYLLQSVVYGVGNVSPLVQVDNRHKQWIENVAKIIGDNGKILISNKTSKDDHLNDKKYFCHVEDFNHPILQYQLYKPRRLRIMLDSGLLLLKDIKKYIHNGHIIGKEEKINFEKWCDDYEYATGEKTHDTEEKALKKVLNIVQRTKLLKKSVKEDDIDCIQKLIFSGIAKKDLISMIFKGKEKFLHFLFQETLEKRSLRVLGSPVIKGKKEFTLDRLVRLIYMKNNINNWLEYKPGAFDVVMLSMAMECCFSHNKSSLIEQKHIKFFIKFMKEVGALNSPIISTWSHVPNLKFSNNDGYDNYISCTPLYYAIKSGKNKKTIKELISNGATECFYKYNHHIFYDTIKSKYIVKALSQKKLEMESANQECRGIGEKEDNIGDKIDDSVVENVEREYQELEVESANQESQSIGQKEDNIEDKRDDSVVENVEREYQKNIQNKKNNEKKYHKKEKKKYKSKGWQEPIYYYTFLKSINLITTSPLSSVSLFCAHTFNSCVSWCKSWFI